MISVIPFFPKQKFVACNAFLDICLNVPFVVMFDLEHALIKFLAFFNTSQKRFGCVRMNDPVSMTVCLPKHIDQLSAS